MSMDTRLAAYLARLSEPSDSAAVHARARTGPTTSLGQRLRQAGLMRQSVVLLGSHVLATGLYMASWVCIGSGALSGRVDPGLMLAWGLTLVSTVPLRWFSRWVEGVVALGIGGVLKERLFEGALSLDARSVRTRGVGSCLSESLETEAIAAVGASGGLQVVLALLELLTLPLLLLWGALGALESVALIGWFVLCVPLFFANLRRRARWTKLRLGATEQLVESMLAHRTRLAQEPAARWHLAEDEAIVKYGAASRRLDRSNAMLEVLPFGYRIAACLATGPALVGGDASPERMAVSLAVILFPATALERLVFGLNKALEAWMALSVARPALDASPGPAPEAFASTAATEAGTLDAGELVFTHPGRTEPILRGCSLKAGGGARVLVQGASGSGKSTLAALLAGLEAPSSGSVRVGGLDLFTLGEQRWRSKVAVALQHHENHILSASLGFNLLLSRPLPHTPADYAEALAVCRELGLEALLERMPSGLHQMVGENGWRLSQGERGRVFLARVLLQRADIVILDESLAALDPDNFWQCLECAERRARTLIVIAHP